MSEPELPNSRYTRRTFLAASGAGAGAILFAASGASKTAKAAGLLGVKPRRGGTVVMAQPVDVVPGKLIQGFNPNFPINGALFNGLTNYDKPRLVPQPELATSWSTAADGLSMTLHLRNDVKFHTGRPFGARDVIFSIKQVQDPSLGGQFHSTAQLITDMSVAGSHSVKLKFAHPLSNIFDLFQWMSIVDRETFADLLTGKHVVGTGPFTWHQWTPGQSLQLTRNPHYWKPGLPYLDGITIQVIPEASTLVSSMLAGQVHFTIDPAPQTLSPLFRNRDFVIQGDRLQDQGFYVGCNINVPPLDNKQVRQALSYAIDSKRILSQVFLNNGRVSASPWPTFSPAYSKSAASQYSYNPQKAKAMLQAAGAGSAKLTLSSDVSIPAAVQMAQLVQYDLKQVGIDTTIQVLQPTQFAPELVGGTLPGLWTLYFGFNHVHPVTLFNSAFPLNAAKNASNFNNATYQQLAQTAWTATSEKVLENTYANVTKLLLDEQFIITRVLTNHVFARTASLKNFDYNMAIWINYDEMYFA